MILPGSVYIHVRWPLRFSYILGLYATALEAYWCMEASVAFINNHIDDLTSNPAYMER